MKTDLAPYKSAKPLLLAAILASSIILRSSFPTVTCSLALFERGVALPDATVGGV